MNRIPFGWGGGVTTESLAAKSASTARLIEWLEAKGLRARQTRLGEYLRLYDQFLTGKCSDVEISDKLLFAMREIDEWSWIYQGLLRAEPEGSFELLSQAIDGVAYAKDESLDTRPRNIQLELRVASYFLQTGFSVSLSDVSDLVVNVEGFPIFVECKRLNSPRQVAKRSKEAARQLRQRYQNGKKPSYGLVVLDASRVIHPKQGISFGLSEALLRAELQAQLQVFDREYDTSKVFSKDQKLVSVWMQAITPAFHSGNAPCTLFSSLHSIYAHEGQRRWHLL